jgi:hypothetical protein
MMRLSLHLLAISALVLLFLHVRRVHAQEYGASPRPNADAANARDNEWSSIQKEAAGLRAKLVVIREEEKETQKLEMLQRQMEQQRNIIKALLEYAKQQPQPDDGTWAPSLGASLPRDGGNPQIQLTAAQPPAPPQDKWSSIQKEAATLRAKPLVVREEEKETEKLEMLQKQMEQQRNIIKALLEYAMQQPQPDDGTWAASLGIASLPRDAGNPQIQLTAAQPPAPPQDKQARQIEILQKEVEDQQKMIELLLGNMRKQPTGAPLEKLQTQAATLEGRSRQAAQRDHDLAQSIDNLAEHLDAFERNGPRLPATLKETFFPSRTNETPFSIYGTLVGNYELFPHERGEGKFIFDGLEPIFLLQLNDHILLESELEFHLDGVEVGYAQADFIINDWLTAVAGRYLAPIGWFNERMHPAWINKLPDFPLMERTVSLADFSLNGLQLRGSHYLCCSPVRIEYSFYVANGLGLPGTDETSLADLGGFRDTTKDANASIAWGERIGFVVPEWGTWVGFSTFFNRPYGEDISTDIDLYVIDANYHKGNWDFRFEWAYMFEEANNFLPDNIHRHGMYAQIAYRPYDSCHRFLRDVEGVFRYSRARFRGIDPNGLDLTVFDTPVNAPVDRDQYTFGINYYVYPSLALKFAYEINNEHGIDLHDNVFLAQLAWGF